MLYQTLTHQLSFILTVTVVLQRYFFIHESESPQLQLAFIVFTL